jgi:glycosyltransferase involved in cell wall biosynthesis
MNATGSEGRENGCRIRSVSVGLPAADEAATGDYVVTMDADGFHPAERIIDLLDHGDDAEAVICSHYVASASAQMSWDQAILSRLLNALIARSLAVPVRDMSSRFRIHQRRVLGDLNLASEKYDVLQEIPVQLFTLGHHVAEIPFDSLPRISGETHTRPLAFTPHFLTTFWRLLKMRNHFRSADYNSWAHDSLRPRGMLVIGTPDRGRVQ